jgi:hypothetical protein
MKINTGHYRKQTKIKTRMILLKTKQRNFWEYSKILTNHIEKTHTVIKNAIIECP